MVIKLSAELAAALNESARRQGITAEELAAMILRERFVTQESSSIPQDEWERIVLGLASDCGVSLPDTALSSEGFYD